MIAMATNRLDLDALASEVPARPGTGLPAGILVGHVHLQVGERAVAHAFYADLLGLDIVHCMSGASLYSSGGYHHHVVTNTWDSAGSGPRPEGTTGLGWFEIRETGRGSPFRALRRRSDPSSRRTIQRAAK